MNETPSTIKDNIETVLELFAEQVAELKGLLENTSAPPAPPAPAAPPDPHLIVIDRRHSCGRIARQLFCELGRRRGLVLRTKLSGVGALDTWSRKSRGLPLY